VRPSDLVHLHLLLNHFPTVGMIVGFGVFLLGLVKKSDDLRRGALAVLFAIALLSLPAYMTGYSAQRAVKGLPEVSAGVVSLHQRSALMALMFMEATGVIAWYGLWYSRRRGSPGRRNTALVLLFSVVTIGLMASTANVGGEIRHPEIYSSPGEAPATEGVLAPHWLASDFITQYQYSRPWAWKTLETIHFMGLCLLLGVVLVGNMRLLGWMREAPLEGFHRLLPWGVWGFVANAVTGMMFFIGQAFQYIDNVAFHWKMLCILLAGADVLYLTWHDEVWDMGPGDRPPTLVKVLAASQIALWIGVIYFGRMLPYLGNAF
jgi:uncharacterized membrane protein